MRLILAALLAGVAFSPLSRSAVPPQHGGEQYLCWRTAAFECNYCEGEFNFTCVLDKHGPFKTCSTDVEFCEEGSGCVQPTVTYGMHCPS